MSYILEALKKAQAERQLGTTPDVHAPAIDAYAAGNSARRAWLPFVMGGVAAVTAIAVPLLWRHQWRQEPPAPPVAAAQATAPQPAAQPAPAQGAAAQTAAAALPSAQEPVAQVSPSPAPEAPVPPSPASAARVPPTQAPAAQVPLAQVRAGDDQSVQVSPSQIKSAQAVPSQVTPAQAVPPQVTAAQAVPPQATPAQAKPSQARSVQIPPPAQQSATAPVRNRGDAAAVQPVAAAPAAPPEPPDESIPTARDLPEPIQRILPAVAMSGYMYSKNPADRLVLIDKALRREGDEVAPGLVLERLLPKGAVFTFRGYRYRVPY